MKPSGGLRELAWDERSDRRERRLGDGEITPGGLSLGACGYVLVWLCVRLTRSCLDNAPGGTLDSRGSRVAKGFVKIPDAGLRGLKGLCW